MQSAEAVLRNSGARITHDQADRAFYNRRSDSIHLPPRAAFKTPENYYGTVLHKLAHNAAPDYAAPDAASFGVHHSPARPVGINPRTCVIRSRATARCKRTRFHPPVGPCRSRARRPHGGLLGTPCTPLLRHKPPSALPASHGCACGFSADYV